MYLQITTKCNMTCAHCCYSCNKNGKHMPWNTCVDALRFASEHDNESLSIGGGEPTLHPRFFDILKIALTQVNYVWMATNGSQTKKMYRLDNILNECDFESFECNCDEDTLENYGCECDHDYIVADGKLSVALSTDYFHDPIDPRIKKIWETRSNKHGLSHYELRDVTRSISGIIGQGRAKKNGYAGKGCVCGDVIIKPNGDLRACGCTKSPKIGDIWRGFTPEGEELIYSDKFRDTNCAFGK